MAYVLGLDVGGTASRALLTTLDGARAGFGQAGAANPVTVPLDVAAGEVSTAVAAALAGLDPSRIAAAVMGIAGTGRFTDPATAAAFADAFALVGVPVPVKPIGDVDVAYAAGATDPDGTVVICGTGAIAARIAGWEMRETSDGLGWLLGDLGSGFWLGRAAATLAARELYAGRRGSRLVQDTAVCLIGPGYGQPDRQAADDLVAAVHDRPPRELARLAPLVSVAADSGDPLALSVVAEAAGHLVASVTEIHAGGPVVLAGSVLRRSRPVRDAVRAMLRERLPGTPITVAGPGEVGAARLAARSLR